MSSQVLGLRDAAIITAFYVYGLIVAHFAIYIVMRQMWELLRSEAKREPGLYNLGRPGPLRSYSWQTAAVGLTERGLYIASIQMGRPEFIAIWLTLKTVARSRRWTEETTVPGRAVYNNFLVGNALSIAFAVAASGGIYWLTGPTWDRNVLLAVAVPAALLLSTFAMGLWLCLVRKRASLPGI